jgi:hypothetical protein
MNGRYEHPENAPAFLVGCWRTKYKLSAQHTYKTKRFRTKQLEEGEVAWYKGVMGLRKPGSNYMDAWDGGKKARRIPVRTGNLRAIRSNMAQLDA